MVIRILNNIFEEAPILSSAGKIDSKNVPIP